MLPYLSIFSFLVIFGGQLSDRHARAWLPYVLLFLLWFMGTRYYVGCDFTGYLNRFENTHEFIDSWSEVFKHEGGFGFIMGSVQEADLGYMWLNVFSTVIYLACVLVFCWSFQRPLMILGLMFPILLVQLGMSGLRQALAVGFLMLAMVQFVRGRVWWTAAAVLAGGMFHASELVFLPIAFLAGRRITSLKVFLSIVLLTPVAALLLQSRLELYADRYIDEIYGEVASSGALIRYVLLFIPAALFLRFRKKLAVLYPQMDGLFTLFAFIIFAMLPVAAISTVALHRLSYYVMPVSILMLVYLSHASAPANRRSIKRYLPAAMYGVYCVTWFATSRHADLCYVPYQSYTFM